MNLPSRCRSALAAPFDYRQESGCGAGEAPDRPAPSGARDRHRLPGLSDRFFTVSAFHGLHGRSVTYATGIKLANPDLPRDRADRRWRLRIGGHHLINAARRNIGITVIVFNNLNFGMTGGEHSVTTPPDALTVTTPHGNLEHPLDICATVAVNGAGFAARTTIFDKALPDLMAEAIQIDGFALVDIWELCTAYLRPPTSSKRIRSKRL